MPVWFAPLMKALPHLATIATATGHAFTKRRDSGGSEIVQQQILELQAAVSKTDTDVRDLATQVRDALATIEHGAALTDARLQRLTLLCTVSLGLAVLASLFVIAVLVTR